MISNIESNYKSVYELFDFDDYQTSLLPFKQCRSEVRKCKFKSREEYLINRKSNWPINPGKSYKNQGWINWHDFLGKQKFPSFKDCRSEVRSCEFKGKDDYIKNRKSNWPSNPHNVYKNKGWIDYYDFLDNPRRAKKEDFISFKQCRKEVRKCKFKSLAEYQKNRKSNWPSSPYQVYEDQGFIDSYDFLGIVRKEGFLPFKQCRKEVRKCKFKSIKEYQKNRKSNWPCNANEVYGNEGWIDYNDFLGKKK